MPKPRTQLAALAVAALATVGCPPSPDVEIGAWMACIECINGELNAVVQRGSGAIPRLKEYVINGAPSSVLDSIRDTESDDYQRLLASGYDSTGFRHLDSIYAVNTSALFQIRAARALRFIGGQAAMQALDSALAGQLRPDIRVQVQGQRDSIVP